MTTLPAKNKLEGLRIQKPQPVCFTQNEVITGFLPGTTAPVVLRPGLADLSLAGWMARNRPLVEASLHQYGGILFRDFVREEGADGLNAFRSVTDGFWESSMSYQQRSSPRTALGGNVYTSTDHPADQSIHMHNELSYAPAWPMKIMFFCATPAAAGGETPIADSRRVCSALSAATREKFAARGIRYRRNLNGTTGLPWQEVFQTGSRAEAEEACRHNRMTYEWKEGDRLELTWTKPAVVPHPVTGQQVWFNHGLFFNRFALDPLVNQTLTEDELPFNTFYGDGTPIETEVLAEVAQAFEAAKVVFPWQRGDLLLLDNMLMAHGRNPYVAPRKIAVAMFQPRSQENS